MAEATQTRPRPGGTDLLSEALDDGMKPLDAAPPAPGMTGHPFETPEVEETLSIEADGTLPREVPPRFRHQSHEEAERAYDEAQRKITEETQRRTALEREAELYRQQALLLEQQLRERTTSAPAPEHEATPAPAAFSAKDHFRQAYENMGRVNPQAEDFEAQQQAVFIDALDQAFARLAQTTALTDAQITAKITAGIETARAQDRAQSETQTRQQRIYEKLKIEGEKHGLDMASPTTENVMGGAHFAPAQYIIDRQLYPADADEDAAIAAVVAQVQQRYGSTTPSGSPPPSNGARPEASPPTSAQRAQALNTPMERSGMGRSSNAPDDMDTKSMTISEMLSRSMRSRQP